MWPLIVLALLAAPAQGTTPLKDDVRVFLDTIESLQEKIEDFQCEYEGTNRFVGPIPAGAAASADGLVESFSGVFIWKRGGDTYSESLHRNGADGRIVRRSLVLRAHEHQAEQYERQNDAPLGYAVIQDPKDVNSWQTGCFGVVFLLDKIKRDVFNKNLTATISDDEIDGRPLKVLTIGLSGFPDTVVFRYWLDMKRNGHVVQLETYGPGPGGARQSNWQFELSRFTVGGADVWMPVSAVETGYLRLENQKIVFQNTPTRSQKIYVVGGTMQFNKHPGRDVFTIKYKPGTPISDSLRKLQYEFGQQKIGAKPTKAEAENMLKEQLAKAEEQKSALVVASTPEGLPWSTWLPWGFSVLVIASLTLLWIQRRGR